jgi:phosphoglycerate dehydrogenase-like enzyme
VFAYGETREELLQLISDADVYVGFLDDGLFQAAKKLAWVQQTSTGSDGYLAISGMVDSDVLLSSARGTHAPCVAESALAMILALCRGIHASMGYQQQREWAGRKLRPTLTELTDTTLGIIGFGSIGRSLAKLAQAHEMRILAVDLLPGSKPDYVEAVWPMERLADVLRESDFVVVTVPGTGQSIGMIGEQEIRSMKPTATLIGVSRGGVIDQDALAKALRNGQLAAAALDVAVPEPLPPDSDLWGISNLLLTPHIAGGTQHEHRRVVEILEENLGRFIRKDLPLRNQVDKKRGF